MNKAVLYARVSDESQIDNWSLSAQKHEFIDICQQKHWQATIVYGEEGVSAHSDSIEKRPQFRRLLEDCKKHAFDVVVVHSLDRWSRNLRVTLESFKQLADNSIAFVSITENIDYSTPEGKLFIAMLGAFAQYYSDSLAKHTSKGLKERALNGLPNGDLPFGYRRGDESNPTEDKKLIYLVPDEAESVKQLFQMYAGGNQSLASLAAWLNDKGLRTRNKRELKDGSGNTVTGPRPFTLYSVRWLLHNPFFTGKVSYRGQLHPGIHEAIISQEIFDHVQERLKIAKNRNKTFSPSYRLYLLKGLARCIYCGYPLWSETSLKGYTYYREAKNSRAHSNCPANGKTISGRIIDDQLESLIKSLILIPSWKEKIIERLSTVSEREDILNQRKQIEGKLRRLAKTYIDGLIEEGEYNIQRKLLQDTLDSLVIPEEDAAINAGKLLENLGTIWQGAILEEKHKLLSLMLEAVYVDLAASRSIVGIQPKPVFYPLFNALENQTGNNITVFHGKKIEPTINIGSSTVMVETGESRTPPETRMEWLQMSKSLLRTVSNENCSSTPVPV
jgi:DNA invertase Pin-like site-specific DNA recombinase